MMHIHTPLKLRSSIRRLRRLPHPVETFLYLVWPLPWHFPVADQLTPQQLLDLQTSSRIPPVIVQRQEGIDQLTAIPLFKKRDTPLRSLYRMYEDLCAGVLGLLGYEAEYFFYRHEPAWALTLMPDPCDKDTVRYAILASLTEALVDAVNWRLSLGLRRDGSKDLSPSKESTLRLEKVPEWVNKVPGLEEPLCLIQPDHSLKYELKASPAFLRRNMRAYFMMRISSEPVFLLIQPDYRVVGSTL